MQVIEGIIEFERHPNHRDVNHRPVSHRLKPGLDVSVLAGGGPAARGRVSLGVRGGTDPVRVYLYVDGTLVESWTNAPPFLGVDLGALEPGRHAVTARAIDITGRWGGSSILVDSDGIERLRARGERSS
jgi:hypothetical protein